jgi:NitT/TauT family transport system substrate-binding protein
MKRSAIAALAVVLIALVVGSAFVYQNFTTPKTALEQVTVGHVPIESFALLYIAQNQGFFTDNGLNVTIIDYSTGATAVNALTSGVVDIAGSSEYVVALNAVEKQNISIIASCGDTQIVDLIARNDHGITQPSDLRGKTVGTAQGTVAEFDLGRFLEANGLTINDINLVYLPPTQFAAAIGNGSLDAVVSWQIYNEQVKMQLISGYADWPLQTDAPFFSVLSCRNDWLSSHSDAAGKMLTALSLAQDYLNNNPAESKQIIMNRFNYTSDYLASVWGRNNCTLSLDHKLVSVMQEEAAWMINNNLTTQKTAPAIANYIDTAALKTVKPEAVTIP